MMLATALLLAAAQSHAAPPAADAACSPEHAAMGHCTPKAAPPPPPKPAADAACPPEHAAMGHCTPKTAAPAAMPRTGTDLSPGNAPAPPAPAATYADRIWGSATMAAPRAQMVREHGGGTFSQVMIDIAEYRIQDGRDAFAWNGEGWVGGDVHRFVVKSEGTVHLGDAVEDAEVQALYSRAIGPYFNLQAGVRHDIRPRPARTYATLAVEGLAPYWFDVEGALFLSDRGDLSARVEGYYDQRITQRLVLQPRAELNLAGTRSGGSDIAAGLRLRYEIAREFAPYVGVSWERKLGRTARLARAAGEDASTPAFVLGVRAWF